jgi:hypothetical protein
MALENALYFSCMLLTEEKFTRKFHAMLWGVPGCAKDIYTQNLKMPFWKKTVTLLYGSATLFY